MKVVFFQEWETPEETPDRHHRNPAPAFANLAEDRKAA